MKNDFIFVSTSNQHIKDKIEMDVFGPTDLIYWYIKFNVPLDARSVNNDTMNVMDANANFLDTSITYNSNRQTIVVTPLESYEQNKPYILTIFKKVCSITGQPLKDDIQVVFKLRGTEIADYKVLKGKEMVHTEAVYEYQRKREKFNKYKSQAPGDILPQARNMINPLIGLIGILMLLLAFLVFEVNLIFTSISVITILGGISHIILQFMSEKLRSNKVYNQGVDLFNNGHYQSAYYRFENALLIYPSNPYAQFGIELAKKAII